MHQKLNAIIVNNKSFKLKENLITVYLLLNSHKVLLNKS